MNNYIHSIQCKMYISHCAMYICLQFISIVNSAIIQSRPNQLITSYTLRFTCRFSFTCTTCLHTHFSQLFKFHSTFFSALTSSLTSYILYFSITFFDILLRSPSPLYTSSTLISLPFHLYQYNTSYHLDIIHTYSARPIYLHIIIYLET